MVIFSQEAAASCLFHVNRARCKKMSDQVKENVEGNLCDYSSQLTNIPFVEIQPASHTISMVIFSPNDIPTHTISMVIFSPNDIPTHIISIVIFSPNDIPTCLSMPDIQEGTQSKRNRT
jgi:hypothetical protein